MQGIGGNYVRLERHPKRVLGMSASPLLAPEAPYETDGGFLC